MGHIHRYLLGKDGSGKDSRPPGEFLRGRRVSTWVFKQVQRSELAKFDLGSLDIDRGFLGREIRRYGLPIITIDLDHDTVNLR